MGKGLYRKLRFVLVVYGTQQVIYNAINDRKGYILPYLSLTLFQIVSFIIIITINRILLYYMDIFKYKSRYFNRWNNNKYPN